ncbi:MAG: hypothetical protein RIQ54_503 [Candidatus Parcubacteria bacterium]
MLDFSQMMLRLIVALAVGVIIGFEREAIGKEAGIRTLMSIAAGAALFTIIALQLPFVFGEFATPSEIISRNGGFFAVIANIVVGIGFLGAGVIIKNQDHVHGLTTAAVAWTTAALGIFAGLGMHRFALSASALLAIILYILKSLNVARYIDSKRMDETRG